MKTNDQANTQAQVDLAFRTGIGVAAQKDLERIASENALRSELMEREHAYRPSRDGALRNEVEELQGQLAAITKERDALRARAATSSVELLEWMHSNEVFKRTLRRCWLERLQLPIEDLRDEIAEEAMKLAQEDPKFVDTRVTRSARERLAAKGGAT